MRSSIPPKMSNLIPDLSSPSNPATRWINYPIANHNYTTYELIFYYTWIFYLNLTDSYHQIPNLGLYQFHIYSFQMPWWTSWALCMDQIEPRLWRLSGTSWVWHLYNTPSPDSSYQMYNTHSLAWWRKSRDILK